MDSDPLDHHSSLDPSPDLSNDSSNFPFFDPPFIEEMHTLTGRDRAENMRHIYARIELLDCLAEDPQVIARIETWGREIGLIQAAEELATVLDRIAQSCGLAHRADLWPPEEDNEDVSPVQDEALADELRQQLCEGEARYQEAMTRAPLAFEAAVTFVRDDLRLPWPWLACELYMLLLRDTHAHVMGIEVTVGYRFDPDDPPVAPFTWTFETRPGETLNAARHRFTQEANAAFAQLQALPDEVPPAELGRIRRDIEKIAKRNTRWFYHHRICQVPQNQLAKTYHDERSMEPDHRNFPDCSCRTNVHDGIEAANRILGLTPFHF